MKLETLEGMSSWGNIWRTFVMYLVAVVFHGADFPMEFVQGDVKRAFAKVLFAVVAWWIMLYLMYIWRKGGIEEPLESEWDD